MPTESAGSAATCSGASRSRCGTLRSSICLRREKALLSVSSKHEASPFRFGSLAGLPASAPPAIARARARARAAPCDALPLPLAASFACEMRKTARPTTLSIGTAKGAAPSGAPFQEQSRWKASSSRSALESTPLGKGSARGRAAIAGASEAARVARRRLLARKERFRPPSLPSSRSASMP